ncbi:MAG: hypothetical protein CL530_12850 [Aequorivita sp.]|nr:hypothetical protein [Aequorivita sp.]|tara:strand:+ start:5821 stop:6321 length:501 start_codon:yes stop_codon:yes gene_type:complete
MEKNKNIPNFKTPENYFEDFEERLFSKIAEENFPKSTGFKIPKQYFENLDVRILKEVSLSEKPKKVIPLFPRKYFGYAAAIAASLVIGFTLFNTKGEISNLDSLQLAAIDTYIEEGNLNLDLYDVTSYIENEDIANIDLDGKYFTDGSLKEYLLENIDTETLINEQ